MTSLFAQRGYRLFGGALVDGLSELEALLSDRDRGRPGERLASDGPLGGWLRGCDEFAQILASLGAAKAQPVRAILFDKSPAANWSLGWHQDRTICVRSRSDVPGFGPFSVKGGITHVEPPFEIIDRMKTLRIHLDPVDDENGPLMVAAGSHALGKLPVSEIERSIAQHEIVPCHANAGDVWAYATPIVHASARSRSERRRRVLQIDYSSDALPEPLEWLGVEA